MKSLNPPVILIIEDELAYLSLLSSQLAQKGYKVLEATDGQSGLQLASKHHPNLILLDIRMPGMDGLEVVKRLQHAPTTQNIKIVLLTNFESDHASISQIKNFHLIPYIIKSDIELEDLLHQVSDWLK